MERIRAQELEANLDRLCVAASRKAADIDRQRKEYEGARAAHVALQAVHSDAVARSQQLAARVTELEGDLGSEKRLTTSLRQGLADKERQLTALTAEVQRLSGNPVQADDGSGAAAAESALDAGGVIDSRLVTFNSLAQLVEKNSQLLAVARSLADDLDANRQALEAKYAQMRAAEAADTERRIAELTEMCNALVTEAQACKRTADEALRDRQQRDQSGGSDSTVCGPETAADLEAARRRVAELETTVSQLRSDAAESAALLKQQLEAARAGESAARSDAAAALAHQQVLTNASATLQQQVASSQARAERLAGQLGEHRSMVERLERQMEELRAAADKSGEEAHRVARRAAQVEVQLSHLQAQEARAAEAERAASAERERVMAELLAAKSVDAMRQDAHAREVAEMQARVSALQVELSSTQEEAMREKERRADGLEAALKDSRATRAEADMLKGQLEEARTSGAAAAAKAEALGQQLAAAEARLRVLEQQAEQREAHVSDCSGQVGQGCLLSLKWPHLCCVLLRSDHRTKPAHPFYPPLPPTRLQVLQLQVQSQVLSAVCWSLSVRSTTPRAKWRH